MKQYKMIESKQKDAEQLMNDMAKEGWEVISVVLNVWTNWSPRLLITLSKDV